MGESNDRLRYLQEENANRFLAHICSFRKIVEAGGAAKCAQRTQHFKLQRKPWAFKGVGSLPAQICRTLGRSAQISDKLNKKMPRDSKLLSKFDIFLTGRVFPTSFMVFLDIIMSPPKIEKFEDLF